MQLAPLTIHRKVSDEFPIESFSNRPQTSVREPSSLFRVHIRVHTSVWLVYAKLLEVTESEGFRGHA
jgi:hypothetical protein